MRFMDVDLSSYSFANWLRLQPVVHLLKSVRYRVIDRGYRKRPARSQELGACSTPGDNLLISIGFDDAELIGWQSQLVKRYVPSVDFIVVDNSASDAGARSIRDACIEHGCGYVRAPENPWQGAGSRSHALALNWALDNVVKVRRPLAFGFIDADMFPLEETNPFEPLKRQDFYGVVRYAESRWFMWAGFCFFRTALLEKYALDFSQAWFLGLDSGGANWNILYRHYPGPGEQLETSFFPFKPGLEISEGPLQKCGSWIHEVGGMGRRDLRTEKRQTLRRLLKPHLET